MAEQAIQVGHHGLKQYNLTTRSCPQSRRWYIYILVVAHSSQVGPLTLVLQGHFCGITNNLFVLIARIELENLAPIASILYSHERF